MSSGPAEGTPGAAQGSAPPARPGAKTLSPAGAWEQISTLVLAVAIALGVRLFLVEPFRIPSGSMFPTLLIGDHLFVNKFVYGVKLPFSDLRLPALREPRRGDVVVFSVARRGSETVPADRHPELPREEFVKRIVGLPGDRVEFVDGAVLVNGEPVESRDLGQHFVDDAGRSLDVHEVSLDARRFQILDDPDSPGPREEAIAVEPGRYFVLGDNRDHSKDSRVWGTVAKAELKGPAFVLYWSWNFNGSWAELARPSTWWKLLSREMRWERVGAKIE